MAVNAGEKAIGALRMQWKSRRRERGRRSQGEKPRLLCLLWDHAASWLGDGDCSPVSVGLEDVLLSALLKSQLQHHKLIEWTGIFRGEKSI